MKIDELRVLKNDNVNFVTAELQEKLTKISMEHKSCTQIMEEQKHEVCFFHCNYFRVNFLLVIMYKHF